MDPLDVKAKRFPRFPRILLSTIAVLPAVDDNWNPIPDSWMLPGRKVAMTTDEVRALATGCGLMFTLLNR